MGPRPRGRGDASYDVVLHAHGSLQWVHGRAAVVMFGYQFTLPGNDDASMGPRPRGRGDGAGPLGTRQAVFDASMGPRPRGRGDASLLT